MIRGFAAACLLGALLVLVGCAGPATFVSASPPPHAVGEAWFRSSVPAVRSAIAQAMSEEGIALNRQLNTPTVVVGTRTEMPYVDKSSGQPAAGPLPTYDVRASLDRSDSETRVTLELDAVCPGCDGSTPYVWEYPGDVMRLIFEDTHQILSERIYHVVYPERFSPVFWYPPHHRRYDHYRRHHR
jgi:hypothetical protein